jgi:hypothetical protein
VKALGLHKMNCRRLQVLVTAKGANLELVWNRAPNRTTIVAACIPMHFLYERRIRKIKHN